MGLIKDIYNPAFYNGFASVAQKVIPGFDKKQFVAMVMNKAFKNMEWKERMKHTTTALHHFMPNDFKKAAKCIHDLIAALKKSGYRGGLEYMFFPDYIEAYGLNDLETSVSLLEYVTQYISCEFAVRPFIARYGTEMMKYMQGWATHKSEHVRRLASEGSRPRLPWAMALPSLKKDPSPILPILETLKNDPSEYVRRSVANNLNDIAKDHPALVLKIAAKWKGKSKATDAIIKHGCRTLLKQGHLDVLKLYGLNAQHMAVSGLKVLTPTIQIGQYLEFAFELKNLAKQKQDVRLEYGIYYKKSKGHLARKVFKITERIMEPGEKTSITRKQSFKPITTRVFHTGIHEVSVIVNGQEKAKAQFVLKK